jgi:hypothetical protein
MTFSVKKYLDYWKEPKITSRRFVVMICLACSIPYVGIMIFLVILFYSLNRSIKRYKQKVKGENDESISDKHKG